MTYGFFDELTEVLTSGRIAQFSPISNDLDRNAVSHAASVTNFAFTCKPLKLFA